MTTGQESLAWYMANKLVLERQLADQHRVIVQHEQTIRRLEFELERADQLVDALGDDMAKVRNACGVGDDEDLVAYIEQVKQDAIAWRVADVMGEGEVGFGDVD